MSHQPTYVRPTAAQVARVIRWWYQQPGNEAGGKLHAELDDFNWQACHVRSSYEEAVAADDGPTQMLCLLLLSLSETQRRKAIQRGTDPYPERYKELRAAFNARRDAERALHPRPARRKQKRA